MPGVPSGEGAGPVALSSELCMETEGSPSEGVWFKGGSPGTCTCARDTRPGSPKSRTAEGRPAQRLCIQL